jgi:uncharacterized protein (TIGR03083 family)
MEKTDIWPVVHAERKALMGDVADLSGEQWSSPSLCGGWTVRDVLAHMVATAKMTPPGFFGKLAGSGFSFNAVQEKGIASERGRSPADTLSHFETVINSVKHPPGPADTMLGETIVHAQDLRGPLGIQHSYPVDAVVRVADFYSGSNLLIGSKRRIDGLRLRATDAQWSHGTGPEVSGPILALVMAMTGRQVTAGELNGDGAAALRARSQ